jgi:hypothetical protein
LRRKKEPKNTTVFFYSPPAVEEATNRMSTKHSKYVKRSRAPKLSRKQLYGIAVVTLVVVSSLAVYSFFNQSSNEFKVAIVDQLSHREEFSNASFVKTADKTLTDAGYAVTYYKGSDVTVDFYRYLPTYGYKIIVLRAHSALHDGTDAPLSLFTAEPYSRSAHVADQMYLDRLSIVKYLPSDTEEYFGILHGFVGGAMQGEFEGTVIIMMGCNGLDGPGPGPPQYRSTQMLQTLVEKGAKVVIGWNASVDLDRTDRGTARLLHYLLVENKTIKDAVSATNNDIGPDPSYKSMLVYYPSKYFPLIKIDVGNYTIPHGPKQAAKTISGTYPILGATQLSALPLFPSPKESLFPKRFRRKTS